MPSPHDVVLILDFGSQYTQLIARRVREASVFCEIVPFNVPIAQVRQRRPKGIILSGGPDSVYGEQSPQARDELWKLDVPILGICYGFQLLALELGGVVEPAGKREYGLAELNVESESLLFQKVKPQSKVWMSHGDHIVRLPPGFHQTGFSDNALAAAESRDRSFYGLQFHPEVAHTEEGKRILENFLFRICRCRGDWTPSTFIEESIDRIRRQVGTGKAICALSGGVDSTVAAVLVDRAIGENLTCLFVNNGVLRKNEYSQVLSRLHNQLKLRVIGVDASDQFMKQLAGVIDPERKRKIIGQEFISVFDREASRLGQVDYLVQGTLYPDVIESVSVKGPSVTIKSHHNVGGLPETMKLKLVEPLRDLFKDEVRSVGKQLGLGDEVIGRQPFPGPGLAVRILGEVTPPRVKLLQDADEIVVSEIKQAGLYGKIWQALRSASTGEECRGHGR